MSQRIIPNDSVVYINSTIYNDTEFPIKAEYSTSFTSTIIDKPGDYHMAISRFSIPNTQPIFEFKNIYYVTIFAAGQRYTTQLLIQPIDQVNPTNDILNYQQFIDMINTAFEKSYILFKTSNPTSTTTNAPRMVYNPDGTFSLLIDSQYQTELIRIYFNTYLYDLFLNSFNIRKYGRNLSNKQDIELIIQDQGLKRETQLELKQFFSTLSEWYDFRTIVFTNNTLPIKSEHITTRNQSSNTINQSILTDFVPENGRDRSPYIYNANPYRLVDMAGQQPLNKIDFRVQYINKSGEIKPIYIEPGYTLSVKFVFIRKDPTQNYYL